MQTQVNEFLGELDAGVFEKKIATALSQVAMGVVNHDKQGKVIVELTVKKMDSDGDSTTTNSKVQISHKLAYVQPTKRGKVSEEDTTATPMYVHKGGRLSVTPERVTKDEKVIQLRQAQNC